MEKLESIQYSVALAVKVAWMGTSRVKLYAELGWESLNLRRWYRRLVLSIKLSIISLLTTRGYHDSPRILFVIQLQLAKSMHERHVLVQTFTPAVCSNGISSPMK